jgi:GntR family transcriptional regulator
MIRIELDKQSPTPFYRQIVEIVRAGISSGRIAPGDKLPTIRELAVQLGVNPNTIVKAYSHLQLLGVLDTQQGSGVFVRARNDAQLAPSERGRVLADLCRDFVSRAQLLGIGVDELVEHLRQLQVTTDEPARPN